MPKAGQSMEEGTLVKWNVQPGARIKKGEIIFIVETDKATVDVEAVDEGRLARIVVPQGETVPVQTPVAYLAENDADVAAFLGGGAPVAAAVPLTPDSQSSSRPSPARGEGAAAALALTGPVTPIVMPKAGQSMEEGTIVKWNVQPGARIKKGEIIFIVETDKATVDVEAVDEGRLARIVVPQGETVPVQAPVAYLAENDADADAVIAQGGAVVAAAVAPLTPDSPSSSRPSPARGEGTAPAVSEGGRVKASPAARKLAQQRGVSLAAIGAGSGPGGRVLSSDVAAAVAPASVPVSPPGTAALPSGPAPAGGVRRKMSQMRKAIARNLTLSKQTIPHFYLKLTVNAEPMFAFYKREKTKYPCSVNDVVLAAVAKSVSEFPQFRSRMENNELIEYPTANIGVAVGMDEGLSVPVIVAAEKLSLQQIGAEAKRLAEAARKGKVEHMGEGVFTVTNLGMFGIEEFAAIINPPEAAILAIGAAHDAVVPKDGAARVGKVMTMTLSVDHRVIDGMVGAKFLARMKELLENPAKLV
jgi:pyruvate dehydrogenase E2 component (dihydrolipoamide acetyltransferase)